MSREELAVSSEIAYVWPSVAKIKIEKLILIYFFQKRRKYWNIFLYTTVLPWWQRTMLKNQNRQLPGDLETKSDKSKAIIIVRRLEEFANKK